VAANLPLKVAIIRSGRSQISLAAHTGIPESRISRIVNSWTKATPTERRRIARALRVSEDEIFGSEASQDKTSTADADDDDRAGAGAAR